MRRSDKKTKRRRDAADETEKQQIEAGDDGSNIIRPVCLKLSCFHRNRNLFRPDDARRKERQTDVKKRLPGPNRPLPADTPGLTNGPDRLPKDRNEAKTG